MAQVSESQKGMMIRPENTVKHRNIPTLDGWRAVAILSVLGTHTRWPVPFLATFFMPGGLGVVLFFALSGFLITSRILEEHDQTGAVNWKNFYLRRAFRILPPAFFLLFVMAILGPGLHMILIAPSELASCAFFYRNYLFNIPGGGWWYSGHFWSLAVEEHFYLLWPAVLCIVGVARGARASLILACATMAWGLADGHFDWVGHLQPAFHGYYSRTDYRIGVLFWGCFLAFVWHSPAARMVLKRVVRGYWVIGVLAGLVVLLQFKPRYYQSGIPRWYLCAIELLIAFLPLITVADSGSIFSRLLETRLLVWIGRISYSLYLWQELFLTPKAKFHQLGVVQQFPFNLIVVFLVAACSYYLIERPFIHLGRQLQKKGPGRQSQAVPESATRPLEMSATN